LFDCRRQATVARGQLLRAGPELALSHSSSTASTHAGASATRADRKAATAVFVERATFARAQSPIRALTAPLTPGVGEIQPDEQRVVDRTTRSRVYEYSYLQAQDGSPVMVLTPALSG
jgi:hypothetical protein